jgi:hypothetical protein
MVYEATAPSQGSLVSHPLLLTDRMRCVAVYEFAMKLANPAPSLQGTVINSYS